MTNKTFFNVIFLKIRGRNRVTVKREKVTKAIQTKECSWEIYLLDQGQKWGFDKGVGELFLQS